MESDSILKGLDNSNIFARLSHGQKTTPLEEGDDKTESLEEESEEEESSRSGGERSITEYNSESSSSGPTNKSEEAVEDNPEMEIHHDEDVVLSPIMEVVPASNPEMEIGRREGVVMLRMPENALVAACAIVVKESLPVVGSTACAIFDPPFLTPHVLIGGFSVPVKYEALYTKIWERYRHIATSKKITSRFVLVKRVEEVLSSIYNMCNVTGHTVSEDVISS
ncbi:uncharacterized protein LOC113334934 [Papaver somniferum]|uniref:uncharacterized protein LOC113334934 n=1 Tax=Papaver somniferum TaxID=3469 RepID=UPI000E7045EB|nr:uncharacterized protein LOC113334934 [Papaver somniferum]